MVVVTEGHLSPAGATYRQTDEDSCGSFNRTITGKDGWHKTCCCKQRIMSLKARDGYDNSPELDL